MRYNLLDLRFALAVAAAGLFSYPAIQSRGKVAETIDLPFVLFGNLVGSSDPLQGIRDPFAGERTIDQ